MLYSDKKVEDTNWDVSDIVKPFGTITDLLKLVEEKTATIKTFEGKIAQLSVEEFISFMKMYGEYYELSVRAMDYASLRYSVDTSNEQIAGEMQKIEELFSEQGASLTFVDIEINDISEEKFNEIISNPDAQFFSYSLIQTRRAKPYQLSVKEESVMTKMSVTGESAWSRLFEELSSAISVDINGEPILLSTALADLHAPDREKRKNSSASITKAFKKTLKVHTFIYNTLINDHFIEDKLRNYPTWITQRNMENDASDQSVEVLVDSCTSRYDIAQRWYKLKAKLLGLDKLEYYDRYAPLSANEATFEYGEACDIVHDAYKSFSPKMTGIFENFMDNQWIDAPIKEGKRGGAFCAPGVSDHHPFVLLNWTNSRNDVLTLAHEMGHACHAVLAAKQGPFHQDTGLTFAETASVFAESVTFNRLLSMTQDKKEKLELLAEYIDGQIATVFRQIAMHRFEEEVHNHRRTIGELTIDDINGYWTETQQEMFGDSVIENDEYSSWWTYISHVFVVPGYVYAYAYGQLLALSVYAKYKEEGESFVAKYEEMLGSGGSNSPVELAKIVGVDLEDPQFWNNGLKIIEQMVDEAELLVSEIVGK
jgi:oligoendopeptidase F